jgi:hypothetical protein
MSDNYFSTTKTGDTVTSIAQFDAVFSPTSYVVQVSGVNEWRLIKTYIVLLEREKEELLKLIDNHAGQFIHKSDIRKIIQSGGS